MNLRRRGPRYGQHLPIAWLAIGDGYNMSSATAYGYSIEVMDDITFHLRRTVWRNL